MNSLINQELNGKGSNQKFQSFHRVIPLDLGFALTCYRSEGRQNKRREDACTAFAKLSRSSDRDCTKHASTFSNVSLEQFSHTHGPRNKFRSHCEMQSTHTSSNFMTYLLQLQEMPLDTKLHPINSGHCLLFNPFETLSKR